MKSTFLLLLSLSPLSFADELLSSTESLAKFLINAEVMADVCAKEKVQKNEDVENSEVKIMYPCSVWKDKLDLLEAMTDKKKIYKDKNGVLLTSAQVDVLTKAEKDAAEKKAMTETSDIIFSKISPMIDSNKDGKSDLVIRTRLNETTGEKDYTIKLRPMEPNNLKLTGVNKKNIKCERDVSSVNNNGEVNTQESLIEDRSTISCSQTLDDVTAENEESKNFLRVNGIALTSVVPYPAIKSEKRSLKAVDLGFAPDFLGTDEEGKAIKLKIALEKWQVPGLTAPEGCFLELSAKAPVGRMNEIGLALKTKFESKLNIKFDPSIVQGNKTGQALKLIEQKK